MKRAIAFIVIAVLASACCLAVYPRSSGLISTAAEKLAPAIEKVRELLPALGSSQGDSLAPEDAEGQVVTSGESDGWPLPSLGASFGTGILNSTEDVALVPTDDYGYGYVFYYGGEEFAASFDAYSWRIYDSYRITNHDDIVIICQALLDEHPVYGRDWESLRTAEDMAFEWEQHNLAYQVLPEDSHWRDDAKDADLDPDDQGKTFIEMYESRT